MLKITPFNLSLTIPVQPTTPRGGFPGLCLSEANMGRAGRETKQQTVNPATEDFKDWDFDEGVDLLVGNAISDVERSLICATLARYKGNKTRAAKVLGISVRGLRYKTNGSCPQS
jgi:DNA-binding NtrC family response regulator